LYNQKQDENNDQKKVKWGGGQFKSAEGWSKITGQGGSL
jgi:hypothetical protein